MRPLLVADDEPDIRLMLRTVLRPQGWKVEEASSGDEALAQAYAARALWSLTGRGKLLETREWLIRLPAHMVDAVRRYELADRYRHRGTNA